jgi:capsular exopolysaccharide synthesis family protein
VDDDRRRRRPLSETDVIDEAALAAPADVQVFHLSNDELDIPQEQEQEQQPPAKPRKKWLEDARTTIWEGDGPPAEVSRQSVRAQQQSVRASQGSVRAQQQSVRASQGSVRASQSVRSPVRASVRSEAYAEPGPRQPRLIEAPVRIRVQNVARISPDPRLWLMTRPDSDAAEQFRVLALKVREECGARVVVLAAPTKNGEGALAAANLALAFAEGGRNRTVLVDADLRGSEIGGLFELREGPGLGEQIRHHRRDPDQNWVTLGLGSSLHLLPAGPPEKNPASLLSSEVVLDLMDELRRFFDFIVLAGPPVVESADVNILQEHVDGVVLVVRAGVTRRETVTASIKRLGDGRFLGTVLVDGKAR